MIARRLPLGTVAVAVVGLVLPLWGGDFVVNNLAPAAFASALIAMSVSFLIGYGGMVSFGQTGIAGVAGYSIAYMTVKLGFPWFVATLAGIVLAALSGLIMGLLAARAYGLYFVMITLALGLIVYYFASTNFSITNGTAGLYGLPKMEVGNVQLNTPLGFYFLSLAIVVLIAAALWYLLRTQFGLSLQGVRDNPARLRSLGHSVYWHRVWGFVVASIVASLGGTLMVWYSGGIAPGSIDLTRTVEIVVMAVIGGVFSINGTILGAWLVTYLEIFMSTYTDRYNTVIGVIFIVVLYVAPGGLGSIGDRFRKKVIAGRRV